MDRISLLPDNVLQHILSFLPMNYVVATSLLARRWRNLWTSVPNLDFDADKLNDRTQISKVVSLCLMRYEGLKVHKFRVSLPILYVDRCLIDTWISFAKKHNVEELDLDFSEGLYEVPQHLSNCDTLKVLNLSWCDVTHPLRFLSLKKLYLHDGLLLDLDTSGIPLLEDIVVSRCNYNGSLSIHAPNPKLRNLKIYDPDECGYTELVINAPHLLSLEIVGCLRGRYDIKDFSSITNVNLNFNDMFIHGGVGDFTAGGMRELLKNVRLADNLKLSQWCIQVLSMLDAQNLEIPVLNTTCLELETNLNKWELPGITCVLKNSPRLQTLVINFSRWDTRAGFWQLNEDVFENIDPWEILELVLSLSRLQLKTVQLNNLLWTASGGARVGNIDLNECLKYAGNLIKLLRLLLMCCGKLDTVIIEVAPLHRDSPITSELLHHLSMELRVRAMASANVEICFA